ncbi:unnamed protein product [Phytomonas sp. Hart1]|nr:unnamed protein product [Phytomonas sp. Hart1]|eukprot:CCW71680.1 unnamed protein product [Phytomonas sp. isolate Hart1]
MWVSKTVSTLASGGSLTRLPPCRETFRFSRFMSLRVVPPLALLGTPSPSFTRRFQSTRVMNSTGDPEPSLCHPSPSSSSSTSPMQPLYKSSHRGRGEVAMPRPQSPAQPFIKPPAGRGMLPTRSSCAEDVGPVPDRPLTPLQKRQLLFKDKAAFVLTPQALRRLKYLISQYHRQHPGKGSKEAEEGESCGGSEKAPSGIRIGVRRRGCSGYSYTVNYYFDSEDHSHNRTEGEGKKASDSLTAAGLGRMKGGARNGGLCDVTVEQDGVKVVVDGNALFYVLGTEMDYVVRNVEEKFTFKNPNQKHSCGCEESFMPFGEEDLNDD